MNSLTLSILAQLAKAPISSQKLAGRLRAPEPVIRGYLKFLERQGRVREVAGTWVRIEPDPNPPQVEPIRGVSAYLQNLTPVLEEASHTLTAVSGLLGELRAEIKEALEKKVEEEEP